MSRLAFLVLALLAAGLSAQRIVYVPDSNTTGSSNVIPFGHLSPTDATWSNQKYQTLIPAETLGAPGLIREMAFVPMANGTRQFRTIKVQLAHTTRTTMTDNFATNLGSNPVTVLDTRNYFWSNAAGTWCRIGFQKDFDFNPRLGNLLLDIEVTGAGMPDTVSSHPGFAQVQGIGRLFAFGWTTSPPPTGQGTLDAQRMEVIFDGHDARRFGRGCRGSNNSVPELDYSGTAQIGSSRLSVRLSGALATRPAVLVLGLTSSVPFPIDLTSAGAPGCTLYLSPDILLATISDASGAASVPLPIPNDQVLTGLRVYNQFAPIDLQANRGGATTSNFGRLLLGN